MQTKTLTYSVRWGLALVLALGVWLLIVGAVIASSPLGTGFTYQGFLKDDGSPANGAYDLEFRLFDAATDGAQVGTLVAHDDVTVTNGLFVVQLDFGADVFTGDARWLEIGVSTDRATISPTLLAPRQALTAAPYALHAASTGALQGYPVTGAAPSDGQALVWSEGAWQAQAITGTVGITAGTGLTLNTGSMSLLPAYQLPQMCGNGQVAKWNSSAWECAADSDTTYTAGLGLHLTANQFVVASDTVQSRVSGTCGAGYAVRTVNQDGTVVCEPIPAAFSGWALTGNTGTDPAANFIGTSDNVTFTVRANNAPVLQFVPNAASPNLIGGYSGNWITPGVFGAFIGGGGQSGDLFNRVTDHWGVIGGGQNNQVGNDDADPSNTRFATVGGGGYNTAGGGSATIAGGWGNTADGADSTIGGGSMNVVTGTGTYATISGGRENTAGGEASAIGGGRENTAGGNYAAIGGGLRNTVTSTYAIVGGGHDNVVGGHISIIGGGGRNTVDGDYSFVGGGYNNSAAGDKATVSGGYFNTAAGDYSFAAGRQAQALHNGAFVWADSTAADYASTATNQFAVRATGGVTFNTGGAHIQLNGNSVWHGGNDGNGSFIGTTDEVTFTVRVSDTAALQIVPNATSPNLIGGYNGNWVTNGVFGAFIGGGGQSGDLFNRVTDHWGVIGGGQNNQVGNDDADPSNTRFATVGGGGHNTAGGGSATIAGGWGNTADGADSTIGGGSINVVTGTGTYATISGGRENTAGGASSAIGGGHSNIAEGGYSFIGGGYNNTITGTYASIVGGRDNTVTSTYASIVGGYNNTVTGAYAIIAGGQYNTAGGSSATVSGGHHNTANGESSDVSGGHYNTASGPAATVSGGGGNTAAGDYSFVAGRDNTANGASATVSGGYFNTAAGDYSFVAGGFYANASHYGEQAHASGQFAAAGDAQTSVYVLRRAATMPNGAWHDLFLDGSSALLTVAISRTVTFDILISGRTEAGESAGYRIEGLIENVGGTTALVGAPDVTTLGEDDAAWNVQVIADDTLDTLRVQVQGNGETIRWVARVTTVEVSW